MSVTQPFGEEKKKKTKKSGTLFIVVAQLDATLPCDAFCGKVLFHCAFFGEALLFFRFRVANVHDCFKSWIQQKISLALRGSSALLRLLEDCSKMS